MNKQQLYWRWALSAKKFQTQKKHWILIILQHKRLFYFISFSLRRKTFLYHWLAWFWFELKYCCLKICKRQKCVVIARWKHFLTLIFFRSDSICSDAFRHGTSFLSNPSIHQRCDQFDWNVCSKHDVRVIVLASNCCRICTEPQCAFAGCDVPKQSQSFDCCKTCT